MVLKNSICTVSSALLTIQADPARMQGADLLNCKVTDECWNRGLSQWRKMKKWMITTTKGTDMKLKKKEAKEKITQTN